MTNIALIAAISEGNYGIGLKNKLPWSNKFDQEWFKYITTYQIDLRNMHQLPIVDTNEYVRINIKNIEEELRVRMNYNILIMGRITWESIGFKSLKQRTSIVITSDKYLLNNQYKHEENIIFVESIDIAMNVADAICKTAAHDGYLIGTFIIGGQSIYDLAIRENLCGLMYISIIKHDTHNYVADKFFPRGYSKGFSLINKEDPITINNNINYQRTVWLNNSCSTNIRDDIYFRYPLKANAFTNFNKYIENNKLPI